MQLFALVVIFVEVLTAGTLAISNPNSGFAKPVKTAVGKVLGISYLAQDTTEQPPSDQPSSNSDQPAPAPDQNSNNQPAAQPQQQTQSQPDQTQQSQPNQQQVQTQPNQTQESQVQQDQSAPQDATQNSNPSPDTGNSSSQVTGNTQQVQTTTPSSTSDQLKTDEQSLLNQTPTETPAPSSQNNDSAKSQTTALEPSASEAPQETPTPIPTPPQDLPQVDELTSSSQQALLNTDDVISTPQKVDESSQNEAKQEDKTLENLSPNQQTQKLLEFSKSKILDIDRNLKEDDFSTTSFLAQRLDNQLSQVSDALSKTTGTQNTNLRKQVSDFCKQASLAMQSQETFVPEDMEQDIQIARGQCMALE